MSGLWHDDFEAAGYKPYRNSMRDPEDRFYQGSWQKRIRDERGTRYFLNVDLQEFESRRTAYAEVQFHDEDNMNGEATNVGRAVHSIDHIEAFVGKLWRALGCGYYEVDQPDLPTPINT